MQTTNQARSEELTAHLLRRTKVRHTLRLLLHSLTWLGVAASLVMGGALLFSLLPLTIPARLTLLGVAALIGGVAGALRFAMRSPKPTRADALVLAEHIGGGEGAAPLLDSDARDSAQIAALATSTLERSQSAELAPLLTLRSAMRSAGGAALALIALVAALSLPADVEEPAERNPHDPAQTNDALIAQVERDPGARAQLALMEDLRRDLMLADESEQAAMREALSESLANREAALAAAAEELAKADAALKRNDAPAAREAHKKALKHMEEAGADGESSAASSDEFDEKNPANPEQAQAKAQLEDALQQSIERVNQMRKALAALSINFNFDAESVLHQLANPPARSGSTPIDRESSSPESSGEIRISTDAWDKARALSEAARSDSRSRNEALERSYAEAWGASE